MSLNSPAGQLSMKFLSDISTLYAYQDKYQFLQDLIQPFVGIGNILLGITNTLIGFFQLFTGSSKRFTAGLITLGRGLFEVASTPFTWTIIPLARGIATLIPRPKITAETARLRQEFAAFATKNVSCFEEGTYFLVSMMIQENSIDDTLLLYPGADSKFCEGATIPDQYRDPINFKKIHPDLDIQIRIQAHRVFHEQILRHRISVVQKVMFNESVVFFESRGGGAILKEGQLIPQYKSGVLNGKWSIPFIGQHLAYGELRTQDRPRFDEALRRATNPPSNTQDTALHPAARATKSNGDLNPQISEYDKKATSPRTTTNQTETRNYSSKSCLTLWKSAHPNSTKIDPQEEFCDHGSNGLYYN